MSEVEAAVLRMLAGGMTDAEAAFALDLSMAEYRRVIADINRKFGTQHIHEAVAAAIEFAYIETEL